MLPPRLQRIVWHLAQNTKFQIEFGHAGYNINAVLLIFKKLLAFCSVAVFAQSH